MVSKRTCHCGLVFTPRAAGRPQLHCSKACRRKANSAERVQRRMPRHRAVLNLVKTTAGCAACGYDAHPVALDFDHLPGYTKREDVSRMHGRGWSAIWEEIMKCEVVCANCHRIRTEERRAYGK